MTRPGHARDCMACAHLDELPALLAAERAALDEQAAAARAVRASGEQHRWRLARTPYGTEMADALADLMRQELEVANVLSCSIRADRAHLDRVEAAHLGEEQR